MIILFLVLSLIHVGNSQLNVDLSGIETDSCGLQFGVEADEESAVWINETHVDQQPQRVYGGEEATLLTTWYPWAVEIKSTYYGTNPMGQLEDFYELCTGSILNRNWIITAAHCFITRDNDLARTRLDANKDNVVINIGMYGRRANQPGVNRPLMVMKPSRILTYPQYSVDIDNGVRRPVPDIALVRVAEEIEFTMTVAETQGLRNRRYLVNSICLPRSDPNTFRPHTSAGFGLIGYEKNSDHKLMAISMRPQHGDDCLDLHLGFIREFIADFANDPSWLQFEPEETNSYRERHNYSNRVYCSIIQSNHTICHGDSGGPLMIQRPDGSGRFELTGINRGSEFMWMGYFNWYIAIKNNNRRGDPELAMKLQDEYGSRFNACGHQPTFVNTHEYLKWIRLTINMYEQAEADLTNYGLIAGGLLFFFAGGQALVKTRVDRARAIIAERRRREEVERLARQLAINVVIPGQSPRLEPEPEPPPLTPSGV